MKNTFFEQSLTQHIYNEVAFFSTICLLNGNNSGQKTNTAGWERSVTFSVSELLSVTETDDFGPEFMASYHKLEYQSDCIDSS